MGGEDDREGEPLDPVDQTHQLLPEAAALRGGEPLEFLDVDPAGDDLALGPDQQATGRIVLDLVQSGDQLGCHRPVEKIERRTVQ